MTPSNLKIKHRLGAGFGVLLLLMSVMIFVGIGQFNTISASIRGIVERDWPGAAAASSIDSAAREDARRTLALFILTDREQRTKSYQQIDRDKLIIDAALLTLEQQASSPEEKALIKEIQAARTAYTTSFLEVADLVEGDALANASARMNSETFPRLDALLDLIKKMVALHQAQITAGGQQAASSVDFSRQVMLAIGGTALLVSLALAMWITASITRPLGHAVSIAKAVANGNLATDITVRSQDEMGQLLGALGEMNHSLVQTVSEVRQSTIRITASSTEIAEGNLHLSGRTELQASSLEETVRSIEQVTATVKQNADNAARANELAISASSVAKQGGNLVAQVVSTMGAIKSSSSKIVDIINVIDSIAFQTNILALNAAVEAARAGEQGRGFAVVAAEVRGLAQRSAVAAKEIKELIDDSVRRVDDGSELVDKAGHTMELIVVSVHQVTDIMSDITAASRAQSMEIDSVNAAIAQMDQITQQNAALVDKAAVSAQRMLNEANSLSSSVSAFDLGDRGQRLPPAHRIGA
ncbi:methyl-accepting chemotaxis protein ['Massilia aquatica' Lu et al. 2020]|uniref:HAMP domain-containing protein n=1 Tax=Pseudoduganella aquatica TaxID=2660641 RepID=A0A7X4H6Q8_9BURK|nr:methyl-accepting chemotaxis protein [Pseudoduganella aquatica]MYN05745.1 HAMP domain-containing protein [Pseudoduganella aquatica]